MTSPGFIVALVFAAVFGSTLIGLVLYYTHRYIHQQCLQLDHWFHLVSPRKSATTCCDQDKNLSCETCLRSRAESTRREKNRERSKKRYQSRNDGEHCVRELDTEWMAQTKMERPKRLLQMEVPAQNQWFGQPQYHQAVWQKQMPVPTQMQHPRPVAYPQVLHQGASPVFNASQTPNLPHATGMPDVVNYPHYHQQVRSEVRSDSTRSKDRAVQEDSTPIRRKRNRGPDKIDYIHICDELPSIVLKNLKKSPTEPSTTSSSSSASGGSDTTQEVPRVSIPRASPPAAEGLPSQYPQYSYVSARTYAPTTRQKPWTDDGAEGGKFKGKSRYALFEPMDGCAGQTRRPHIYVKYSEPSKAPIRH